MNRKISKEETKKLFLFCHKHHVEHYDLQVELVDHLASAIEEQWETDAEISFQDALKKSFSKFGIYGFTKIKKKKIKELQKKYNILHRNFLFKFYSWPKLLLISALTIIFYMLLSQVNSFKFIYIVNFIISIIFVILYYLFLFPKSYKINIIGKEKFILLDHLNNIRNSTIFVIILPLNLCNIFLFGSLENVWQESNWAIFAFSFYMVNYYISLYSFAIYTPGKIKEHFMENFAEFVK